MPCFFFFNDTKMSANTNMEPPMSPEQWLQNNWPVMNRCDANYTMERYDFPSYVRNYIKNKWVKVNDEQGGTYEKPTARAPLTNNQEKLKTKYQENGFISGCPMDDANATAAAVMATEGGQAAVSHMFTREDGSTRSYSEMRSMYG